MTIDEAIKEIEDSGKMLGMGDYVDLEALKVAVEVMKDYQRVVYANERLLRENKSAFEERDRMHKMIMEKVSFQLPTMNITITKEQADELGFKHKKDSNVCDKEKCRGCEKFGWVCDYEKKIHGYFTCKLQNKKCADTHVTAEFISPQHFSESQMVLYDD